MRLKATAFKEMAKSLTEEDRREIMSLLMPGFDIDFMAVVNGLNQNRAEVYALLDLHFLNLPITGDIFEQAYQNAGTFLEKDANINDRLQSLIEVLKRSGLIQEAASH